MNKVIPFFRDQYGFLSNFYPCHLEISGIKHESSETAYQASKTFSIDEKEKIAKMDPGESKRYANNMSYDRVWWGSVKLQAMEFVLRQKFKLPNFRKRLIETGDMILIEGNWWHDNFWGTCVCDQCGNVGENNLGKLLMKIREEFKNGTNTDIEKS